MSSNENLFGLYTHTYQSQPRHQRKTAGRGSPMDPPSGGFILCTKCKGLQDVIRNINIFRDVAELISHIALVDGNVLVFEVRRIEGEVF